MAITNGKSVTKKKTTPSSRTISSSKSTLRKSKFNSKLVIVFALLFASVGVFVVYLSQAATAPQNGELLTGISPNGTDAATQKVPTIPSIDRAQPAFVPNLTQLKWMKSLNTSSVSFQLAGSTPPTRVVASKDGKKVFTVLRNNTKTPEGLYTYTISSFNLLDGTGRKDLLTVNKSAFFLEIMLSRDENSIVFKTVDDLPTGGQHHGLFTFSIAGANAKANGTTVKELSIPEGNVRYNMLGFTPENKLLYYFADFRTNAVSPDYNTIGHYTIGLGGNNKVYLGSNMYNAIEMSPDGKEVLAYDTQNPQFKTITIYNLDGSTKLSLSQDIVNKILVDGLNSVGWSPDGKFIYLDNYIVDAATGKITSQVAGANFIIHWLPVQS